MKEGRGFLRIFLVVMVFIAYFLVASRGLDTELLFKPEWVKTIAESGGTVPSASPIAKAALYPFDFGTLFGYFDQDGNIVFAEKTDRDVALSANAYCNYPAVPKALVVRAPDKSLIASFAETGSPILAQNRIFVVTNDSGGLREYSKEGKRLWARDFASIVTAADFSPTLAAVGLLDGRVNVVGDKGQLLFDYLPGGSRIAAIYGVAISSDGEYLAMISGLDPQRLVLMQRRGEEYATVFHKNLDSEFRGPARVFFSSDSKELFFEQQGSLGVVATDSRSLRYIPVQGEFNAIQTDPFGSIFLMLTKDASNWILSGFKLPADRVLTVQFKGYRAFLFQKGRAIYVGIDESIMRIDMLEG